MYLKVPVLLVTNVVCDTKIYSWKILISKLGDLDVKNQKEAELMESSYEP